MSYIYLYFHRREVGLKRSKVEPVGSFSRGTVDGFLAEHSEQLPARSTRGILGNGGFGHSPGHSPRIDDYSGSVIGRANEAVTVTGVRVARYVPDEIRSRRKRSDPGIRKFYAEYQVLE